MENRLSYAEVRVWRRERGFFLSLRSCREIKMLPNVHAQGQNSFLYCSLKIANYVSGNGVAAENLQILFMASAQLSRETLFTFLNTRHVY